jgi:predicted dehydrogenase
MRIALIARREPAQHYARSARRLPSVRLAVLATDQATVPDSLAEDLDSDCRVVDGTSLRLDSWFGECRDQFDAVVIDGVVEQPYRWAARLAADGKHVLVESCGLADETELDALRRDGRSGQACLMVGQVDRYGPYAWAIDESLREGKLGKPGLLRMHHWIDPPREGRQPDLRARFAGLWSASGRQMDLACWYFGALPNLVFASGGPEGVPAGTSGLLVHLGFEGGGMALLDASVLPAPGGPEYEAITLIGGRGAAYADDHHNGQLLLDRAGRQMLPALAAGDWGRAEHRYRQLQLFLAAARQGTPAPRTVEDERRVAVVARAARQSLSSGASLRWQSGSYRIPASSPRSVTRQNRGSATISPGERGADQRDRAAGEASIAALRRSESARRSGAGRFRVAVLSVVKHDYIARGILSHDRFQAAVVADDPDQPDWVHRRNQRFAAELRVPYVRDVGRALEEHDVQVAVVSPEAARHCDLSVRAALAGLHIVQDKPMSTSLAECDRLVRAVRQSGVKFLMWNRNYLPALLLARETLRRGDLGRLHAVHVDFYFAKDAGPPLGTRRPGDPPLDWLQALRAAHATGADGGVGPRAMGELEVEGIYPLAYFRMLGGAPVKRVLARTAAHFHQLHADHRVDDLASVTLEMEDGSLGSICLGRIGNASHPDLGEIRLRLQGSRGTLVVAEPRPEVAVHYRGQPDTDLRNVRVAVHGDWLLADDFARAIAEDTDTILNADAARAICATVHAALASARSGTPVFVDHLPDAV